MNNPVCKQLRVIGLTGGIASGKSSVARFFQDRGICVIDADQLARIAVEPGSFGLKQIIVAFGNGVLDDSGCLDRKLIASEVFSDPAKRTLLEGILHPEIKRLAEEQIAIAATNGHKVVIYMAPLLIEAGAMDRVDELWVVTVRPEVQLGRLMRRDSIDRESAQRIIDSQMPLSKKESYGSIVIENSGTPEETAKQLTMIWKQELEGKI